VIDALAAEILQPQDNWMNPMTEPAVEMQSFQSFQHDLRSLYCDKDHFGEVQVKTFRTQVTF